MRRLRRTIATVAMGVGVLTSQLACGPVCRPADVTLLEFECNSTSAFTGEIHLDSEASFDTFLRQECMPMADESEIQANLDSVDFETDAVFIAVGPNALDNVRCLESREYGSAEVCSNGLKVSFDDAFIPGEGACPGTRWTVAFAIKREDLRAALEAVDALQ